MRRVIYFLVLLIGLLGIQAAYAGGTQKPPRNSGFYITAEGGGANFQNGIFTASSILLSSQANSSNEVFSDNGLSFIWSGGIGWQFNSLFRMDITYLHLQFPLILHSYVTSSGLTGSTTFLKPNSNVYLVNAYIDLVRLFGHHSIYINPYIGGGIGYARNDMQDQFSTSNRFPHFPIFVEPSKRNDFVYRVMLGFTFPITTGLKIFAQYSFLSAGKYQLGTVFISPVANGQITEPVEFHVHVSTFSAGLTYLF